MTPEHQQALHDFVAHARWFGGKGRGFAIQGVRQHVLSEEEPRVVVELVTLTYDDGGTDLYQVPLSSYAEQQERLAHAIVSVEDGRHVYDAMHDREATRVWLEAFDRAADGPAHRDGLSFHRSGSHDLDLATHSTLFSGEQSNSSVAFGEDALMKVFRRVTPGVNPDIEIHDALSRAGTSAVAHLFGWVEVDAEPDEEPLQLAMLQQFLRTASDGWELALASARNLFAEGDLHADEVGGDFAGEAHRLGVAVSEIHELLREQFPTVAFDAGATGAAMRERLEATAAVVPELAEHVAALSALFDGVGREDAQDDAQDHAQGETAAAAQRVHGDLHLGQTLRTSLGWKLVDFEGEPAKPLEERRRPDSPWRDVAGMLRSFDYAARSVVKDLHSSDEPGSQIVYRATEWADRNRSAFLEGYVAHRRESGEPDLTSSELALIDAYEADKAVYEALYEARNRPGWLDIPLGAIERIGAAQ